MLVFTVNFVNRHGTISIEIFATRELAQAWANLHTNGNYYVAQHQVREEL